jgi:hypothetical protein
MAYRINKTRASIIAVVASAAFSLSSQACSDDGAPRSPGDSAGDTAGDGGDSEGGAGGPAGGADGGTGAGKARGGWGGTAGTGYGGNATGEGGSDDSGGEASGGSAGTRTGNGGSAGGDNAGGAGGTECSNASECAAGLTSRICDPDDRTCKPAECDFADVACPKKHDCFLQPARQDVGACYPTCAPNEGLSGACAAVRECVPLVLDRSEGICLARGTGAAGEACLPSDVTTGCAAGLVCVPDGGAMTCRNLCDYFSAEPECPTGERCVIDGFCSALSGADAALGAACGASSREGDYCGDDGRAWRGLCLNLSGTSICSQACRSAGEDCPSETAECYRAFPSAIEVGLCVERGGCADGGGEFVNCQACFDDATTGGGCCYAETQNCTGSSACFSLLSCIDACASDACIDACVAEFPNAVIPLLRWVTCLDGSQEQEFLGACGVICADG